MDYTEKDEIARSDMKKDGIDRYNNETKLQVVEMYLSTGNMKEVEAKTGIPYVTLKNWKKSKWWDEFVRAVKGDEDLQLSTKVSELLHYSLAKIKDRVENGDSQYDPRTGELIRIPVKAQVLNAIAANLGKQRMDLNNQPTEHEIHDKETTNAKLAELATAFAAFVGNKKNKQPIEVTNYAVSA